MSEERKNKISFELLENAGDNKFNQITTSTQKFQNKKILAGVCSTIGSIYNIDPFYIRLAFIFSLFIGVWGITGYLAAAIIISKNNFFKTENSAHQKSSNMFKLTTVILLTLLLVLIFYISELFEFFFQPLLFGFSKDVTLFLLLITSGSVIFLKRKEITAKGNYVVKNNLYRTIYDKKIGGVCGGLAVYFYQDSSFIRLLWILFTFITAGLGVIIYVLYIIIVPAENLSEEANGE